MFRKIFVVLVALIGFGVSNAFAQSPRYTIYDGVQAEFADGMKRYAPQAMVTTGGSFGAGINSAGLANVSVGVSTSVARTRIYAVTFPKGTHVNFFGDEGNQWCPEIGKNLPRSKKLGGNPKGYVLIGFQGTYYYIDRSKLGTARP